MENDSKKQVGDIGNYYGCLWIKREGDNFYWGIEDMEGTDYSAIPKYLYEALIRYTEEE